MIKRTYSPIETNKTDKNFGQKKRKKGVTTFFVFVCVLVHFISLSSTVSTVPPTSRSKNGGEQLFDL